MYNKSNFFEGPIEKIETDSGVFLQDLYDVLAWFGFTAMRANLMRCGIRHGANYVYPIKVYISGQAPVFPYVVCHVISDTMMNIYFTQNYDPTILPLLAGAPTLLLKSRMKFHDREE